MPKHLLIVESPAKAKTIEKYLGKDYQVMSSYGHIRDLPKKGMSIDIAKNFEPTYEVAPEKAKTVAELKKAAKTAETVWLATDEDREGEAIAWHLAQALGLDAATTKRIVFHEITKPAIEAAIAIPRTVNLKLVDAQQARRILDRLVGYELSPILWKKVRRGLSAGRVQSVAVRLIVEREREIKNFEGKSSFKVKGSFSAEGKDFSAELPRGLADAGSAKEFLEGCKGASFSVASLTTKPTTKNPSPPFTTSTLQQAASNSLGFSVRQTMVLAQKLYEAGLITYMRTDSLNLAAGAIKQAEAEVGKRYGSNYFESRHYKAKTAGAQEAHEAIRPTDFRVDSAGADNGQQKLYGLIWRRALASQMAAAKLDKTEAGIAISTRKEKLLAKGEMVTFDGWLKLYAKPEQANTKLLPPLKEGQTLQLLQLEAAEGFSKPKPRYSEASLVKQLEAMGIGRPSTYAPTISTIQYREYVEKVDVEGNPVKAQVLTLKDGQVSEAKTEVLVGAERNKLHPTDIGEVVTDFLVKFFPEIVDYDFTVKVEGGFDEIAAGKEQWQQMLKGFYEPFHKTVEKAENIKRTEAVAARILGNDPKTGKPILARIGRYGPMVQIGEAEDEEKPIFAGIPEGTRMDSITLEQALELFSLPRVVGKTKGGEEITANFGPYGPYVKHGSTYVSIKPESPFNITEAQARGFIADKAKKDAEKHINEFQDGKIKVLNGPYGPYITDGTKNARVPKDKDPKTIGQAEAEEMLANAKPGRKRRRSVKK